MTGGLRAGGLALTTALVACADPPPPAGIVDPAAIVAPAGGEVEVGNGGGGAAEGGAPLATTLPASLATSSAHRLVGLTITLENPPAALLDARGAGVIEVIRTDTRETARLVFLNGALTAHALTPGPWRIRAIAGQHCGFIDLPVPRDIAAGAGGIADPISAGALTLSFSTGAEIGAPARLSGRLASPEDLARLATLSGGDSAATQPRPLLRPGAEALCKHIDLAVSRPDIDPAIEVLTPLQIAEMVLVLGAFGAITGAAAATGSVAFVSGGGGLVFAAF
ncbi:MAG: hypothetical protein AAF577_09140 [Pseudomonadota bacterium]